MPGRGGLAPDLEVLGHRQVGEDAPVLGHVAEPEPGDLVRRAPVDARAFEANLARARLDEAHQRLERGRLAGAVAAEEGDDFAPVDREVEAEQDLRPAVAGAQAARFKHRQGTPRAPWGRRAPRRACPKR